MLVQLARALAAILGPLRGALSTPVQLDQLLASAGWQLREAPSQAAVDALADALGLTEDLDAVLALADGEPTLDEATEAVAAGARVLSALSDLAAADPAVWETSLADAVAALPPPLDATEQVLHAIDDVAAALVSQWLAGQLPVVRALLRGLGVMSGSSPERVDWAALVTLVSDPGAVVGVTYGWGESLRTEALHDAISAIGGLTALPLRVADVGPELTERWWGAGNDPPSEVRQYEVAILDSSSGSSDAASFAPDLRIVAVAVPDGPDADPWPTGLLLAPVASAGDGPSVTFPGGWSATATANADTSGIAGLVLRPSPGGGIVVDADADAPDLGFEVVLSAPQRSWTLGDENGVRSEVQGLIVALGIRAGAAGPEPYLNVAPHGALVLTLAPSGSDGFLHYLLGDGVAVEITGDIDVSPGGIRVSGSGGLDFSVWLDKAVGVLHLERIDVALNAGADAVELSGRLTAGASVGPIDVAVEGLGAALEARHAPDGDGALGQLDLGLVLLPPTGLGLDVDLLVGGGGGYLSHDPTTGRYAGAIELDFLNVGLTAVGVLDTAVPGDPDGWALFLSISAALPSIPLGFGFFLSGVGGLASLNRTMDTEALADGLRSGALDSLFFPDDPLADAATILAQLDSWFPMAEGATVVGIAATITWGAPPIVTGELGVILSLPEGDLALLGGISMVLPSEESRLVELHMDALGVIDTSEGTVSVTATLYDSALLRTIHLSGDMAMYARFDDEPFFLLAVGGYHPQFQPPGYLPASVAELRRIRAEVRISEDVWYALEGYFALTSNTLQFGANATLEASAEFLLTTYTARGWVGFDVLLVFSPFAFVADFEAGVSITAGDEDKEVFAVSLAAHLEGPQPWYATGRATFDFFGINVKFNVEVGSGAPDEAPPRTNVLDQVVAALSQSSAWRGVVPSGADASAVLIASDTDAAGDEVEVWTRPNDELEVIQQVAPLDRTMDVYGNYAIDGPKTLVIGGAGLDDGTAVWSAVLDWFAPSQFDDLSRKDKLGSPSYEQMTAGVLFGSGEVAHATDEDQVRTVTPSYEVRILDEETTRDGGVDALVGTLPGAIAGLSADNARRRLADRSVESPRLEMSSATWCTIDATTGIATSDASTYREALAVEADSEPGAVRVVPTYAAVPA